MFYVTATKPMAMIGRKNPILTTPADEVLEIDDSIIALIGRMHQTVKRLNGAAIAAPQVGVGKRLAVTKERRGDGSLNALINFTVDPEGKLVDGVEGCLSIPGRWYTVPRAERCSVIGVDADGKLVELMATGFEARMWQHEYDHMLGLILAERYPEAPPRVR